MHSHVRLVMSCRVTSALSFNASTPLSLVGMATGRIVIICNIDVKPEDSGGRREKR